MINRKLLLIIISVLIIGCGLLTYYNLKDDYSFKNDYIQSYSASNEDTNKQAPSTSANNVPVSTDGTDINKPEDILPDADITEEKDHNTVNETEGNDSKINVQTELIKKPSSDTVSILFLGIDRTEKRDETNIAFSADTIMLAKVDLDNKTVKVLSIPRDTHAYIPIIDRMDKINYSYAYGYLQGKAVRSTIDAIDSLLGTTKVADYYFTLDMEPVPDIIDELGGVELDVEIDMLSHGANLSKGLQLLDGEKAFDYIHWRYSDDGDIGRINRQHKFIKALSEKLKSLDMNNLLKIILSNEDYIDTDLGLEQMANLFSVLSDVREEDIEFKVLPGKPEYIGSISYWIPDEKSVKELLKTFFSE